MKRVKRSRLSRASAHHDLIALLIESRLAYGGATLFVIGVYSVNSLSLSTFLPVSGGVIITRVKMWYNEAVY